MRKLLSKIPGSFAFMRKFPLSSLYSLTDIAGSTVPFPRVEFKEEKGVYCKNNTDKGSLSLQTSSSYLPPLIDLC
jgi:hypothetical protein